MVKTKVIGCLVLLLAAGCGPVTRSTSAPLWLAPNEIVTVEQAPSVFAKSCTVILTDAKGMPVKVLPCVATTGAQIVGGTVGIAVPVIGAAAVVNGM